MEQEVKTETNLKTEVETKRAEFEAIKKSHADLSARTEKLGAQRGELLRQQTEAQRLVEKYTAQKSQALEADAMGDGKPGAVRDARMGLAKAQEELEDINEKLQVIDAALSKAQAEDKKLQESLLPKERQFWRAVKQQLLGEIRAASAEKFEKALNAARLAGGFAYDSLLKEIFPTSDFNTLESCAKREDLKKEYLADK